MTLIASQSSDISRLLTDLNNLVYRRIELAARVTHFVFPARAKMCEVVLQLEESQRLFETTSKKFERENQDLMDLIADAMTLQDNQLENATSRIVNLDYNIGQGATAARKMIDAFNELRSIQTLLFICVFAGPDIMIRMWKCARHSTKNGKRILTQTHRWQDEMWAMKLLTELGRRRPLTTEEKIQLTQVSIIHGPIIQQPSDRRADWYDEEG